jgi:hypothetical protein
MVMIYPYNCTLQLGDYAEFTSLNDIYRAMAYGNATAGGTIRRVSVQCRDSTCGRSQMLHLIVHLEEFFHSSPFDSTMTVAAMCTPNAKMRVIRAPTATPMSDGGIDYLLDAELISYNQAQRREVGVPLRCSISGKNKRLSPV